MAQRTLDRCNRCVREDGQAHCHQKTTKRQPGHRVDRQIEADVDPHPWVHFEIAINLNRDDQQTGVSAISQATWLKSGDRPKYLSGWDESDAPPSRPECPDESSSEGRVRQATYYQFAISTA